MVCCSLEHSRTIICQFRTVHNILVSVSSLFVSLLGLIVKLGQRAGITDEHCLATLSPPLLGYHLLGLDAKEEEEEG